MRQRTNASRDSRPMRISGRTYAKGRHGDRDLAGILTVRRHHRGGAERGSDAWRPDRPEQQPEAELAVPAGAPGATEPLLGPVADWSRRDRHPGLKPRNQQDHTEQRAACIAEHVAVEADREADRRDEEGDGGEGAREPHGRRHPAKPVAAASTIGINGNTQGESVERSPASAAKPTSLTELS